MVLYVLLWAVLWEQNSLGEAAVTQTWAVLRGHPTGAGQEFRFATEKLDLFQENHQLS